MPQSLAQIHVHLVFSTRGRAPLLRDENRDELHGYIGGIVKHCEGTLLCAGSVTDHIHLLIAHPRTCSPSDLVREIKTGSSAYLKQQSLHYRDFHWQTGYGIFSVSPSHRPALEEYLRGQAEHHKRVDFKTEFLKLLTKYGVHYDPKYIWD